MLVIVLGIATMVYILRPFSNTHITVTNPSGKIQMVSLPDSSRVWLNASTTIRYPESFKNNREIELEGEAYFEVMHDAKKPFAVETGDLQTTVLGTSFNIEAYPSAEKTTVSVITGKVKVDDNSRELARLTPTGQLEYDKKNKTVNISTIDTSAIRAWKNGKLQFAGQTLTEIAATLERWYGVNIVFTNPGIGNCRYYMSFDNSISLEKLMLTMSDLTEMKYSIDKNTITISGTKCQ
jgi:transmembrane sensor